MESENTRFLNLDLEIDSKEDLTPLADYLKGKVFVLYNGPAEDYFHLSMEPCGEGCHEFDADACVQYFSAILSTLPSELRKLWDSAFSKVFDFGFEGGVNALPFRSKLSQASIQAISSLGAELLITIYTFDPAPTSDQGLPGNLDNPA